MPEIEILKAGEWPSANVGMVKIGSEIIDDIVETYDAATFRAPLIVSHDTEGEDDRNLAEHKELAHGFPARLKRVGDRIVAEFDKISDKFVNWNRGGELLSVSASLYPPSSPANPYPGKWSLRHIAGLGKNPPAVKGLAPLSLQAGDGAEDWCFDLAEFGLQDDDEAIDLMGYGKMMMHKNYDEEGEDEEEDDFKERLYKRLDRCENKILWQGGAFRSISDFLAGMRDWLIAEKGLEVADKMLPRHGLAAISEAGRFDSPEFGELMEGFVDFAKGKGGKKKGKNKQYKRQLSAEQSSAIASAIKAAKAMKASKKDTAEHPTGNVASSNDAREADMSELEELQRQVAALKAERDAIADEAKTARLEAIQNFLEGHIDRFTPAMQQQQSISFGEESLEMDALDFMMALEPQHLAWFKNMVKQMPPQVELGEVAGDADAPERVTNLNEQMQTARAKLQDAYNKAAGL